MYDYPGHAEPMLTSKVEGYRELYSPRKLPCGLEKPSLAYGFAFTFLSFYKRWLVTWAGVLRILNLKIRNMKSQEDRQSKFYTVRKVLLKKKKIK